MLRPENRFGSFLQGRAVAPHSDPNIRPAIRHSRQGNLRLSGRSSVRQCTIQTLSENSRKALPSWVVLCDLEADKLSTVHHLASRQVNSSLQEFSSFLFALK